MNRLSALACCALAAGFAFAAPSPKHVPANADLVLVGHDLNKVDPATRAKWDAALAAAGIKGAEDPQKAWKDMEEASPNLPKLIKTLFGVSEDMKSCSMASLVVSVTLPSSAEAFEGAEFPEDAALFCALENPKLDIATLDACIQALAAEKGEIAVVRKGEWRTFEKTGEAPDCFAAYRPVEGGVLFAVAAKQSVADALVAGGSTLPASSPLMKAFTSPDKTGRNGALRVALANLASLLKRVAAAHLEAIEANSPYALHTQDVHAAFYTSAKDALVLALSAKTEDMDSAQNLCETVKEAKEVFSGLLIPLMLQSDSSELAKLVSAISCVQQGTSVTLSASVSPEDVSAIAEELMALQVSVGEDDEDMDELDEEEDMDDEEDTMTEEEARAILDGINP